MAVVIINPNSTAAMTDAMVTAARAAMPALAFDGWTSWDGPPSIQGHADGAAATPPLLALVERAAAQGADGIMIGCFDDTALDQAARIAPCPVIGLGQASYHFAALRQWRFSVVTTLSVSVPILTDNINRAGLGHCLARVRASEVPVLELEADPDSAGHAIATEARAAAAQDNIDAVVLGCAGMVQVVDRVTHEIALPVIDPVTCAARAMGWLTA